MRKILFEDRVDTIDSLIEKYRRHWTLYAINWMDYDDVAQDLRLHIYIKWNQWDQEKPLEPWINRIIHNQIINKFRDHYTSFAKPCIKGPCPFKDGETGCLYTPSKTQCGECKLYAKWEKNKQHAYNIKLPLSMVYHEQEVENLPCDFIDLQKHYQKINEKIHLYLNKTELIIYTMLYIDRKNEEEIAKELGLKTNEKNRKAGYRQIINYKKRIMQKVRALIIKEDILWN